MSDDVIRYDGGEPTTSVRARYWAVWEVSASSLERK